MATIVLDGQATDVRRWGLQSVRRSGESYVSVVNCPGYLTP